MVSHEEDQAFSPYQDFVRTLAFCVWGYEASEKMGTSYGPCEETDFWVLTEEIISLVFPYHLDSLRNAEPLGSF